MIKLLHYIRIKITLVVAKFSLAKLSQRPLDTVLYDSAVKSFPKEHVLWPFLQTLLTKVSE